MQAIVYKSTGSWYLIKDPGGKTWNARMKGVFKLDGITSTNPVAVGDVVDFEMENENESSVIITRIHDRRNYINRQSPRIKSQQHIVAANVDQSLLIATLKEPRTSPGFIDRFVVTCEMYHVKPMVLFNKMDLYGEKELAKLEKLRAVYEGIGYTVLTTSLTGESDLQEIKTILKDKVTLVSGHSGVGKSTFINTILPGKNVKTQDVSGWSGKGQHTTTFAEMYDLPFGGQIIDTPGMKEFGLTGVDKHELAGYFPEMRKKMSGCQFNDCLHINEPGCAVKQAVADGEIDEDRFVNYYNMLESLDETKRY
jgi:ribosome biogenesis GTPase / thiamine phosphate phosphatase